MPEVYDSQICAIHPAGWLALGANTWISRMPVWEGPASGLLCRWGAAEAAKKLSAWGMRLPSWQELEALYNAALFIAPVTLPTGAMLKEAGISASNTGAVDAYRNSNMSSRAWCAIHDQAVFAALAKAGWTGQPVANAGKHWCKDGAIYGWWTSPPGKGGAMIQGLSYAHEPGSLPHNPPLGNHHDYATTVHAVAVAAGGPPASPEPQGGSAGGLYPKGSTAPQSARKRGLFWGAVVTGVFSGVVSYLL